MDFSKEVSDLSQAEQLGEAFMPRLEADTYLDDPDYAEEINQLVQHHLVGGFCVFNGTPESAAGSILALQKIALESHGVPLLFSCDCEWGLPMRLHRGGTEFPDMMALGRVKDAAQTEAIAKAIARELKALGIHWNFAPVADVNSNSKNPIINTRSFGEDPETVALNVEAYVRGLESERVAGSVKHFPGHGDTTVDSHKDLPKLVFKRDRFEQLEFPPFIRGIDAGVQSLMIAHIAIPELAKELGATSDEIDLPATLSAPLCRMIRDDWGYDGILVTDALEMHGLTKYFGNDDACLRSFSAGLDVLLIPVDVRSAHQHMLQAIGSGELSEEKVRRSAERVLALKRWVHSDQEPDVNFVHDNEAHLSLARKAARRAMQMNGAPPEQPFTGIVIFSDARATAVAKARYLTDRVNSTLPTALLTPETGITDFRSDVGERPLIVALHKARGFIGGPADAATVPELLREATTELAGYKDLSVVCLGSPYLDPLFEDLNVSCMIKTFSESTTSIDAVLERLGGLL
ncbi:MAG TPA: glycoside hydrolase family 3 protein [Candidatus Kapabacteria bacterium]|nr:glycoside hydrolase family 3 protein [Candidatus Kapabacteria bacterium]